MKASFYALIALIAISLTACSTLNPMRPTATVYQVTDSVVVQEQAAVAVEVPVEVAPALTIAEMAVDPTLPSVLALVSETQLTCMAMAIYHEARGESSRGQAAVGWVVLNRVAHKGYPSNKGQPDTICGVVWDRNKRGCQFSWVCDGKSDAPRDMNSYKKAREIALQVMNGSFANPVGTSIYFDGYVHGTKRKGGQMQIGSHRFFTSYASR